MTIKMSKGGLIIITIIAILVVIVITGVILYFLFRDTKSVDDPITPEQQCNSAGLRWVDGECRENRVCPEPFYDIGSVTGATGPYDFECGIPNNILSRIGTTTSPDSGKFQIKELYASGDNFTSPEEVTSFWKSLGFQESEIIVGGGPDAEGCTDLKCSEGPGFFYTSNNGTNCTYFDSNQNQYGAHIQINSQGTTYNIDKDSWRNLNKCQTGACEDFGCTIPAISDPGSTFLVADLR